MPGISGLLGLMSMVNAAILMVFLVGFGMYQLSEGGWFILSGLFTLGLAGLGLYGTVRVTKWVKRALGGRWW